MAALPPRKLAAVLSDIRIAAFLTDSCSLSAYLSVG